MYNLFYNDIDFKDLIKVTNVKKVILPKRTNYTVNIPNSVGEIYRGFKYGTREIDIDYVIIKDTAVEYESAIRVLADALNVATPQRLYLGEEADKYYYAIPDAGGIDQILNSGKGTIKFICFDPIAYTDMTKIFKGNPLSGITTINNHGSLDTPPIISVTFDQTAHFLQVTNYDSKTILLGSRPNVDIPSVPASPVLLDDPCNTTTGWTNTGNILDGIVTGTVTGSARVNKYGTGITGHDYGTWDGGWHGPCIRKNLSASANEFTVSVDIAFDSKDTGAGGSGAVPPPEGGYPAGRFRIQAEPCLRIRDGRGVNYTQIGQIPNGTVVDISEIYGGWGQVTYGGVTGYCSMQYAKQYTSNGGNYRVNTPSGLNIRKGRGTNYGVVASMPNRTSVEVIEIEAGWGKVVNYKGKTGYCSMEFMSATKEIKDTTADYSIRADYEEYMKMGRIEVYLFDRSNNQLGKFSISDNSEYYETVQPEIFIGTNCVLSDNNHVPVANTSTNDEGVTVNVDSGKFGEWNDATVRFTLSRIIIDGVMQWTGKIEKIQSGTVTKTIATNTLVNTKYPTGDLSNIAMWIGQYKDLPMIDTISIEHVKVDSMSAMQDTPVNRPIFTRGDEVVINCETNKVYKNGSLFIEELDIGSEFFTSASGDSQLIAISDDRYINVLTGIRQRYL